MGELGECDDGEEVGELVAVTVVVVTETGALAVTAVVVGSRHPPNQPGVLQELVVVPGVTVVVVVEVVVAGEVVLVLSRQPNHPGVLHVLVRVRVLVELLVVVDVVLSDPLLSKYFQLKQSTHSVSGTHSGTLS